MVRKTAKRGPNAGNDFWGCDKWPECKEIVTMDGTIAGGVSQVPGGTQKAIGQNQVPAYRVRWTDATISQSGWSIRYASLGASLRSIQSLNTEPYSNCWIARESRKGYQTLNRGSDQVVGLFLKFLQRGTSPPIHPDSEWELLKRLGFDNIETSELPGDISPNFVMPPDLSGVTKSILTSTAPDINGLTDPEIFIESSSEAQFIRWMVDEFPQAAPWVIPQASFDGLLDSVGGKSAGCRRCGRWHGNLRKRASEGPRPPQDRSRQGPARSAE